jgi:chromosome segregation ATPase
MFRVTTSITGGHEPGEVKPAAAFAGCDVDWLVRTGALVPVGGPARLTAAPTDPAHLLDEVERLTGELAGCRDECDALRSENAHLADQLRAAAEGRELHPDALARAAAPVGGAEQAERLQAELAAAEDRYRQALQAADDFRGQRDALQAERDALRSQLDITAGERDALQAECDQVRQAVADDPQPKKKGK